MMDEKKVVSKKDMPVIYVIDSSFHMVGEKIVIVSKVMHDSILVLEELSKDNTDTNIKVGALKFSSGTQWITKDGLIPLEDFYWSDIQGDGLSDFGEALYELDKKLSRREFLVSESGFRIPAFVFIIGSTPTDDWKKALDNISTKNRWFKKGIKIVIKIGDEIDADFLKNIVDDEEEIIEPNNVSLLKKLLMPTQVGPGCYIASNEIDEEVSHSDVSYKAEKNIENRSEDAEKRYKLILPSGAVVISKDEKYVVTKCQLQCTNQDEALKPCFEVVWDSSIGAWQAKNIGFEDAYVKREVPLGENLLIKNIDDFRLKIQEGKGTSSCKFEVQKTELGDYILHNDSNGKIYVFQYIPINTSIQIDESKKVTDVAHNVVLEITKEEYESDGVWDDWGDDNWL